MSNLVSESLSLQRRILLEAVPAGMGFLETVIQAMKKQRLLEIDYQKYGAAEPRTFTLSPYCIKLYHRRWYLLGRFDDGRYSIFAFDRMKRADVLETTFAVDRDFDAEAFFSDCFGVVRIETVGPQRIVLRAFGTEADSLRDLPLHHSQRELDTAGGHADFEYRLCPTLDFCGYILSRGARLMAVSPQSLVRQLRQMLAEAMKNYQE